MLFKHGILDPDSSVLELGTGISGLVAMSLGPKIGEYIATDQDYIMKFLRQNLSANLEYVPGESHSSSRKSTESKLTATASSDFKNIRILPLDWETSQIYHGMLQLQDVQKPDVETLGLDLILACDCVFNEALIEPFVNTCKELCALRPLTSSAGDSVHNSPTICLVALQLRTPDVLEAWLKSFYHHFQVWRLPDEVLSSKISSNSGFAVFLGVLRSSWPVQ